MQLLRTAAVLTALLPALAFAAVCDVDTASASTIYAPDELKEKYTKIYDTFSDIGEKSIKERWSLQRARSAQVLNCDSNETCYFVDFAPICYNDKTSVFRFDTILTLTLNNGDITLPGGIKGNVFNNVEPIEKYLQGKAKPGSATSGVTGKTSATGTAGTTSATSTASVPTGSASQSQSQSQSGTAAAPSETSDQSAAGKMVVGGWVAAVAALAAFVVA